MKRGFTLIELLVVIAIIGILTAIILPSLAGSKAKARDAQRISDISQLQGALELYFDRCGHYPAPHNNTIDSTVLTQSDSGCPSGVTFQTYISQVPTPPAGASQSAYDYAVMSGSGGPVNYVLHAHLESSNAAGAKSLNGMPPTPSGYSWSTTFSSCTNSNSSGSVDYCATSN
jgi:type II secretion system protein G